MSYGGVPCSTRCAACVPIKDQKAGDRALVHPLTMSVSLAEILKNVFSRVLCTDGIDGRGVSGH